MAVIATNFWAAKKGRSALNVSWNGDLEKTLSTDAYFAACYEAAKKEGINHEARGFQCQIQNGQG